ncbi:MerR family transcriptional regulator [Microbacterium horticulturae]|uniref:MerR family transcriptional regulator n=1 Tax=Microbacterium horticulturae TaxID=3028316 RepID=A0ABY8BY24_9MICO|nr:MerR family transcriptional regulator [Microbacterium sp. KACC 23027]WEG09099.1 MerR family transcriptional regulator [Microbacterium sp. KACC 23027]
MDRTIHEIATLAGTTSRTLRHYDAIGLLAPSRIGANGYRRYDESALVRLQRILLLRELGLPLPQIAEVLDRETSEVRALRTHLDLLRQEKERLDRRIAAVTSTIDALQKGEEPMAEKMFDGFDNTQYQAEVTERWGGDAYARGNDWWQGMTPDQRAAWQRQVADLNEQWRDAAARGIPADSAEAHGLAERHVQWLRGIPGTPAAASDGDIAGYVRGLGEMYVADPRFAANYGGAEGAAFVRDALRVYADADL